MKLGLLWAGRTRDRDYRLAIERYVDRIGRHVPVSVIEVREQRAAGRHAETEALVKESRRLREKIPAGHEVVLFDAGGREMTSVEFARFLEAKMNRTSKGLTFVLGGPLGVDEEMKRVADHRISLSRMTLPHELARLVAAEQIYRAVSIIRGGRYHR